MARDPNIESFFALVEDEDFALEKLTSDDSTDNLQELLWYMDESRVGQVCNSLKQKDDEHRDMIIKNLAKIYPLSRTLIFEIMSEIRGSDFMFIKGFDIGSNFIDMLKAVLNEIENKSGGKMTKLFQDYKKDIENKQKEAEKLFEASVEFKSLQAEKQRLETEIEKLNSETNETQLKQDISQLKDKESRLKNKLRQHKEDYQKLHETINDLKVELSSMENKMDSQEEIQMLRELIKKFPPDTEDTV